MAEVKSIVLAGGGTAGHVNPLLAVADGIRRRNPEAKIVVLGTKEGLEADLVPARGYDLWPVPKVPLPRKPSLAFLQLPGKLNAAVTAAAEAIKSIDAEVVIGFGGYVSTPAYLAAHRLGVPIVIHEGNARPGLANRLGSRWASAIGLTFPGARLTGAKVVGLPLRQEISDLIAEREVDAETARRLGAAALELDPELPTLLVSGGSSGAAAMNLAVAGAAQTLSAAGIQVLHLTGKGKKAEVDQVLAANSPDGKPAPQNYHVREYLAEMDLALACADLVLTRAGAGMVCELSALGIPAIYVPLPVGNGEQRLNAAPVVKAGGGIDLADGDLTVKWVETEIPKLMKDPGLLAQMGAAASSVGVKDGAARIVDMIEEAVARRS
jgi:undecaprenyldiphospho-muramoylpentapeptide beta-N-acetylglucosaminyltransferase